MFNPRRAVARASRPLRALLGVVALALGCSGSSSSDALTDVTVGDAGPPACAGDAAATSPACWATGRLTTRTGCTDTHCDRDGGLILRTADYASCGITAADPPPDAPPSALSADEGALSLYDDLCEFQATVVPTCDASAPRALVFEVELASIEGKAVPAGAAPYIEAFSSPIHPAPSTGGGMETTNGRYRIGPVVFDVPGSWTVTLHFFGTCRDSLPQSPHAHVTMNVEVP
jgi:hypothetical protein